MGQGAVIAAVLVWKSYICLQQAQTRAIPPHTTIAWILILSDPNIISSHQVYSGLILGRPLLGILSFWHSVLEVWLFQCLVIQWTFPLCVLQIMKFKMELGALDNLAVWFCKIKLAPLPASSSSSSPFHLIVCVQRSHSRDSIHSLMQRFFGWATEVVMVSNPKFDGMRSQLPLKSLSHKES